ncbi:hypothetical protein [Hydrogenimonas sp.]
MKRKGFVFLLVAFFASAESIGMLKAHIVENLARLFVGKKRPTVFIHRNRISLPPSSKLSIETVKECEKADVIFTPDIDTLPERCRIGKNRFLFTLSYKDYLQHRDIATGAFFWQKGRPNIIINKRVIERLDIDLPKSYEKYVE